MWTLIIISGYDFGTVSEHRMEKDAAEKLFNRLKHVLHKNFISGVYLADADGNTIDWAEIG